MFFPRRNRLLHVWRTVVEGVINNQLGPTAKVSTDDGRDERLSKLSRSRNLIVQKLMILLFTVCVYTKDFSDIEDVMRVLDQLKEMELVTPEWTIYYKPDAWTYLDLKSGTASKYGLQASLYNSRAESGVEKASKSTMPSKKQSTISFGKKLT